MSAIEVFISYSHKDEELREELENHLKALQRQAVIKAWHDREISAGSEWEEQIRSNIQRAQIILLLVSPDFLASDYCWNIEVTHALERYRNKEAAVVPVILRPCDWESTPLGKLQAVPKNALPVTSWQNRDEAFLDIAKAIRVIVQRLQPNP
ncbi:MAG: toll/interleukin-1 receptor domain-containing protein [Desulfobacterales bacterium]|nr:MAG: toll/interleukin-1 receptor domain-containing protein [Desulfobacterales bacterium]